MIGCCSLYIQTAASIFVLNVYTIALMNKQLVSFRFSEETQKMIQFLYDHSYCWSKTMVVEQAIKDMYERSKSDYLL